MRDEQQDVTIIFDYPEEYRTCYPLKPVQAPIIEEVLTVVSDLLVEAHF